MTRRQELFSDGRFTSVARESLCESRRKGRGMSPSRHNARQIGPRSGPVWPRRHQNRTYSGTSLVCQQLVLIELSLSTPLSPVLPIGNQNKGTIGLTSTMSNVTSCLTTKLCLFVYHKPLSKYLGSPVEFRLDFFLTKAPHLKCIRPSYSREWRQFFFAIVTISTGTNTARYSHSD